MEWWNVITSQHNSGWYRTIRTLRMHDIATDGLYSTWCSSEGLLVKLNITSQWSAMPVLGCISGCRSSMALCNVPYRRNVIGRLSFCSCAAHLLITDFSSCVLHNTHSTVNLQHEHTVNKGLHVWTTSSRQKLLDLTPWACTILQYGQSMVHDWEAFYHQMHHSKKVYSSCIVIVSLECRTEVHCISNLISCNRGVEKVTTTYILCLA
jgi:hypothetical protein